jgi:hypothetical protein
VLPRIPRPRAAWTGRPLLRRLAYRELRDEIERRHAISKRSANRRGKPQWGSPLGLYGRSVGPRRWPLAANATATTGWNSAFHRTDAYPTMADVPRQQRLINDDR